MVITKLEYQKNNPDRVNIYIDGKFAVGLGINDVISLNLIKNQEISPEFLQKIIGQSEFGKLLSASLRFIAVRKRSRFETELYLKKQIKKMKLEEDKEDILISTVIEKLTVLRMIDDRDFARWLVESRRGFRPKGKFAIELELKRKGIKDEIINQVLETSSDGDVSELELAKRTLAKKLRSSVMRESNPLKLKDKYLRFLVSRGFDWDVAKDAVEEMLEKE